MKSPSDKSWFVPQINLGQLISIFVTGFQLIPGALNLMFPNNLVKLVVVFTLAFSNIKAFRMRCSSLLVKIRFGDLLFILLKLFLSIVAMIYIIYRFSRYATFWALTYSHEILIDWLSYFVFLVLYALWIYFGVRRLKPFQFDESV